MLPEDGWAKPQHVGRMDNDDDDADSAHLNLNFYWHSTDPYKGQNNPIEGWNCQ